MTDFEVVPDTMRPTLSDGNGRANPANEAVVAGKTVFVPLNGRKSDYVQNVMRVYASKKGMRIHARQTVKDGVKGFIAWAEPKDADR